MLDLLKIDDAKLSQTARLLKQAFAKRGWTAQMSSASSPHFFVDRKDGGAPLHIFASTPPTTSFAAGMLANNKFEVYQLLKTKNIAQPETVVMNSKNIDEAAIDFLKKHGEVVVKPLDSGHGNGITIGVKNREELVAAAEHAAKHNKASARKVLLQQMVGRNLRDVRILCINYQYVAAINRLPASVTGDGAHTVGQLIDIENSTFRGRAYHAKLAVIDKADAERYLGADINSIPEKDSKTQVLGVANYGRGGELIDISDDIPSWMKKEAEDVSRICGLAVCGVDYLMSETERYVIEVNKTPSLAIHDEPTVGQNRQAVEKYVEYLNILEMRDA
jgi:glutathione synthase/RimK-type ligase-like ATP-grasp enzyme